MNKRHFTLIELMAAMVVLLIMMGFLFQFIISSQNLWSASERNARVYENAQVFFDLLDRDLGGAMVSKVPGQEIGFWIDPANTSAPFLSMVALVEPITTNEPNVYEIHYSLQVDTGGTYKIIRRVVSQADGPDWNFYGDNTAGWITTQGTKPQDIIDGVQTLDVKFYNALSAEWTGPSVYFELPTAVKISVALVDQKAHELGLAGDARDRRLDASRRKFTRVFLLSR